MSGTEAGGLILPGNGSRERAVPSGVDPQPGHRDRETGAARAGLSAWCRHHRTGVVGGWPQPGVRRAGAGRWPYQASAAAACSRQLSARRADGKRVDAAVTGDSRG
jgi:hypothetical protein